MLNPQNELQYRVLYFMASAQAVIIWPQIYTGYIYLEGCVQSHRTTVPNSTYIQCDSAGILYHAEMLMQGYDWLYYDYSGDWI